MNKFNNNVTIAIPVYDRIDFFEEALHSALNQSVKCNVIVVDNGSSTDFFEKTCCLNKVIFYKNRVNIGMFSNWNRCLELTKTEFIVILGDDDILEPNFIEVFSIKLDKYPNLDVFYSDFFWYYNFTDKKDYKSNNTIFKFPFGYHENGKILIDYAAKCGLGFPTISCVFKKDKIGFFYSGFHASNDWLLFYSKLSNCSIYGTRKKLVNYRKHILADTYNTVTGSLLLLSHSYIYDQIIKIKCTSSAKRKANMRGLISYLDYRSTSSRLDIKNLRNESNIYSDYLDSKIKENILFELIYFIPQIFAKIASKIIRLIYF